MYSGASGVDVGAGVGVGVGEGVGVGAAVGVGAVVGVISGVTGADADGRGEVTAADLPNFPSDGAAP